MQTLHLLNRMLQQLKQTHSKDVHWALLIAAPGFNVALKVSGTTHTHMHEQRWHRRRRTRFGSWRWL